MIVAVLQGILQGTFDRLYNFNLETADQKVAHSLVLYATLHGSQREIGSDFTKVVVPVTVSIIASSVFLSKAVADEIFARFALQDYLKFEGRDLFVSVDQLKVVAGLRSAVTLTM